MEIIAIADHWLPVVFGILMVVSVFLYMVLDGYDIGVGLWLLKGNSRQMKNQMVSSIGPYWDANETWLVLSVGILLVAFPMAQGKVLTALYLPVFFMLIGIIMRGVSYEFRLSCQEKYQSSWNGCFWLGSVVMALSQGYMLGKYFMGFQETVESYIVASVFAIFLVLAYGFIGINWLIIKSSGSLQTLAVKYSRINLRLYILAIITFIVAFRLLNLNGYNVLFNSLLVTQIILTMLVISIYGWLEFNLSHLAKAAIHHIWVPFVGAILLMLIGLVTLAFSCWPYIIPFHFTIWDGAASIESLQVILYGVVVMLPCIIGYNLILHKVFWGKLEKLSYD